MNEKYKIHAFYILGILLAVIVILITVKWGEIPNLAQYITFSLTVTSLILAVLAIAYAVYSNSSFSQNISTLNNISHNVSDTARNLSRATEELVQKVEAIPSRLENMEVKVAETNVLLKQYSERPEFPTQNAEEKRATGIIVDSFLDRASTAGLLVLHACSIAYLNKTPFNLQELVKALDLVDYDYSHGFLIAVGSTGIIDISVSKGIWNILNVNEELGKGLRPELDKRVNNPENTENLRISIKRHIELIERYFEVDTV